MIPRRPTPRKLVRAAPAPTGRSQTRPGLSSETPAARSGAAEAGDRRPPSPLPSRTAGRRTFFAFLAGGLAWRAHEEREQIRDHEAKMKFLAAMRHSLMPPPKNARPREGAAAVRGELTDSTDADHEYGSRQIVSYAGETVVPIVDEDGWIRGLKRIA